MLILAIFFTSASLPVVVPDRLDAQIMTSPAYGAFASKANLACPARKLGYLHPADLDGIEEDFMPSLKRRDRHRIFALNKRERHCTGGGASCPAQSLLTAISKAGLLDKLVTYACASAI
ncbi:hypothetical protein [Sphingomonas echinoides]|uniref:hypothetical protein n=1 Tax=Sphingomonas echinoides TaxID=59803 RepID=UPI002413A981|nr:hypothetical protein [Sphingomonas echinoides]